MLPLRNSVQLNVKALRTGLAHVVFMWWDLRMDQAGDIVLSCAPFWAHPDYPHLCKSNRLNIPSQNVIPWRDHWMQALYYVPTECRVNAGDHLQLHFNHDEYSLWFDIQQQDGTADALTGDAKPLPLPVCDCGFHIANSRTRIGQLNDSVRTKKFLNYMENEFDCNSVVLALGDCSLLALAIGAMQVKQVYCLDTNRYGRQVQSMYMKTNQLGNVRLLDRLDELKDLASITHVFGEPSFVASILPWDNFYFGTLLAEVQGQLSNDTKILPRKAVVYAVGVEFLDLHKIRAPLGLCEGFDLNIFDRLVEVSWR